MMKLWMVLFFILISHANAATDPYLSETLYFNYQKDILEAKSPEKSLVGFTPFEQKIYVDALWDLVEDNQKEALKNLKALKDFNYDLIQRLRIGILKIKYGQEKKLDPILLNDLTNELLSPEADIKVLYLLASYETDFIKFGYKRLIHLAKKHKHYYDISPDKDGERISDEMINDIFYHSPDTTIYMNGEYVRSVKVYMFCRENRIFPCLMVMRDVNGEVVRNQDGSIWTHPSLASSKQGLPSYVRNGNTPAGIHTIDSVMPFANEPLSFGKFRRMILNFVPKSKNETLIKSLLPESSHNHDWWRESVVAREIGRDDLRIHGTGKINTDASTPYFPFMRTSGCIAQRENTYDGITYKDQRVLLDSIMESLGLTVDYENEVNIKGILYLINIDDKSGAVTEADLALRGIE
ncbi:MAG: hypothetical protein AB7I27_13650 [Bacteriovoracaceae bacterium]